MNPILKCSAAALLAGFLLIGCDAVTPFRIDVNQGNVVEQEMLDQLRRGMNKRQVQFIMGTPLLTDPFHQDRWDYVYSVRKGWNPREQRIVTLIFDGDNLVRVEGDVKPKESSPEGEDNTAQELDG